MPGSATSQRILPVPFSENSMDPVEQTRETYDRIAPEYCKRTRQDKYLDWENSYIQKMLSFIAGSPPLILDVGCGDGRHCKQFHENGARAIGIDLSDSMLAESRKYFPAGDFRKMNMLALDFPDGHFNGIWSSGSIYHVTKSEIGKVISEFARVLKPRGIVAVNFKLGEGEGIMESPSSFGGGARYFAFYSLDEMENLFRNAGFEMLKSCNYPEEVFGDDLVQMWFRKV